MSRSARDLGEQRRDTAARFRKLVERWRAEDPAYDKEAWPELKEALDRYHPEYRKLCPEEPES